MRKRKKKGTCNDRTASLIWLRAVRSVSRSGQGLAIQRSGMLGRSPVVVNLIRRQHHRLVVVGPTAEFVGDLLVGKCPIENVGLTRLLV